MFFVRAAVVAHIITSGLVKVLAEIVQQLFTTAYRGLSIVDHLFQYLRADFTLGNRLILHELLQLIDILFRIKSNANPLTAVTSGPTGFLVVTFHALWHIVVDNIAYIRFV